MISRRLSRVSFRSLNIDEDVHLLYTWLGDPDVAPWYAAGEHSLENYRVAFGSKSPTRRFVIEIDCLPVGYLQFYWLSDEPEYAAQIVLGHDAVAIDLFIGDPHYRNRGWGAVVIQQVLTSLVFGELQADWACINPNPENIRAVKSYQQAGFRSLKTVWIEAEDEEDTGWEQIMVQSLHDFLARAASLIGA